MHIAYNSYRRLTFHRIPRKDKVYESHSRARVSVESARMHLVFPRSTLLYINSLTGGPRTGGFS